MEYGMNSTLRVNFKNGIQTDILESIEFLFKQKNKNDAEAIKAVVWKKGEETDDVYTLEGDLSKFYIRFPKEDTFKFEPKKNFYLDLRVHYEGTFDNPQIDVVPIFMKPGLFGKGDDYE